MFRTASGRFAPILIFVYKPKQKMAFTATEPEGLGPPLAIYGTASCPG